MEKKCVFTFIILAIFITTGYSTGTSQNSEGNFNASKGSKAPPTTPTPPPPTTTTTTVPITTTNGTSTIPTTITSPTIPTTTSTTPTPTPITSTVTPQPVTSTTSLPPTTVAPPKPDRSFDLPSFVGGIILALGVLAIGYVVYKFYRARTDPNYRTL